MKIVDDVFEECWRLGVLFVVVGFMYVEGGVVS